MNSLCSVKWPGGRLAQLEERLGRNEEAGSSSLLPSTILLSDLDRFGKLHESPELPELPICGTR